MQLLLQLCAISEEWIAVMHVEMLRPNDGPRKKKKKKVHQHVKLMIWIFRDNKIWERDVWLWDNTTSLAQVG